MLCANARAATRSALSTIGMPIWTPLAYVSCSGQPEGRYYVELELPPVAGDNFPYEAAGSHEDLDLESLIAIVASHLARGEPRNV
jgi:hypothetical protein